MDANNPELGTDNLHCSTPQQTQQHEAQQPHSSVNQRFRDPTTGLRQQSDSSIHRPDMSLKNFKNLIALSELYVGSKNGTEGIITNVSLAFYELAQLALDPSFWVMSLTNEGYDLHHENYLKFFPKSSHMKSTNLRIESSKGSTEVPIKASDLAGMLLDMNQWAALFPTIVQEAKVLKALDTGSLGGSLHLMYERMHILSPLVAPREFIFLRYCKQASVDTWLIVDISCDFREKIDALCPTCSWRFPSGILIQSLPNAEAKVTWVERVEADGSLDHPLYMKLLLSRHGYGATRWLYTLQRMSERSLYSVNRGKRSTHELKRGRKSLMSLSLRMIRIFCSVLNMPRKFDLSESSSSKFRMSFRDNKEPGQPRSTILAACTSIRVSLSIEDLFKFLRDENRRTEWDWGICQSSVDKIKHMSTGTHPGNSILILQPDVYKLANLNLLQENSIDPVGAFVIFSPVDPGYMEAIIKIGDMDTSKIELLPCGYMISRDIGPNGTASKSYSTSTSTTTKPSGSILTIAFQERVPEKENEIKASSFNRLRNIITSIIGSLPKSD